MGRRNRFKTPNPQRLLDIHGRWHCAGCGCFLRKTKMRAAHPTFLCDTCTKEYQKEYHRGWMSRNYLEQQVRRGRLLKPRFDMR
jgi:hypothetical protein